VYRWLEAYPFPGNVRELENLVHQTVLLAPEDRVRIGDLPRDILRHNFPRVTLESKPAVGLVGSTPSDPVDFRRRREEIERRLAEQERGLVERVLRETAGNITAAARKLGIHRVTLHRMLRRRTRPGL
jgi:two-component system nitrogen regulation response regulator GlnG